MKTALRNSCRLIFLASVLTGIAFAAPPKVERTGPLPSASTSDALRQDVEDKGYRVTLDDGWTAEFWFVKQLKTEKKDAPGALYPELTDGEFVGVMKLSQGMADFRGQSIPAGTYSLRYQMLPQDGNHMGVSPNPDFLLAGAAGIDSRPEQSYVLKKLIFMSAKSTGTNHPAVIALETAGDPANVTKTASGMIEFTVAIPTGGGANKNLGIILKGTAAQ
jgi:hypothetical protein